MTLEQNTPPKEISRRRFLAATGGVLSAAAVGGGAYEAVQALGGNGPFPFRPRLASAAVSSPGAVARFHSRPDLEPPTVSERVAGTTAPGHLFIDPYATHGAQPGTLILAGEGQPLWFRPVPKKQWATNFRTWSHRGRPVLAWWEGKVVPPGFGLGHGLIFDESYRQLARVRAANGRQMDIHELQLTPQGTALFTCYPPTVTADLSSVGGPRDGKVQESVFQELDLRTGRLLLEWRSLEHIAVSESYQRLSEPYDYLHLNSIAVLPDGNLLVSARHTWALYKLDRRTGRVIWRLGGKRSDFHMGRGAQFAWQHDARRVDARRISLFDDGSNGPIKTESQSRALILEVDETARTARVARQYRHPGKSLLAVAMGSVQVLPGGHVVVGWGTAPYVSEFTAGGELVADARMASGQQSYRGLRLPWQGSPREPPAIAARRTSGGVSTVYASWNGSSDTFAWQLLAGTRRDQLRSVGYAPRRGFETAIPIPASSGYVAVRAVDRAGSSLATSPVIAL